MNDPGPVEGAAGTRGVRTVRTGDLVAGLLTAGFGVAVLVHIRGFPQLPGGQPGPALFPGIVGALMAVFGLALVVQSLAGAGTKRAGSAEHTGQAEPAESQEADSAPKRLPRTTSVVNALSVLAAVVVYMLVAEQLGFIVTMVLLLAALMFRLGTRPLVAAGAAIATTLLLALIFQRVLLVPLPQGPFGF